MYNLTYTSFYLVLIIFGGNNALEIIKKHIKWFSNRLHQDRLDAIAARSAYFIIISFLPFITFLLTLLQEINISGIPLINEMMGIFPVSVAEYLEGLLAQNAAASSVLSASVITFLWSASNGMVGIIKGLDTIYRVEKRRSVIRIRLVSVVYLIAFAVALILTAVTLVFSSTIYRLLLSKVPDIIAILLINFKSLFGFLLLVIFFCLMFNNFPRKATKLKNNFLGAIFSAAGWVLFSFFFSIFVENFSNFSVIYGSLATLIVLMFWLYTCMYILFLGAEVSVWFEENTVSADLKLLFAKRRKKKKVITESTQQTNLEENSDNT